MSEDAPGLGRLRGVIERRNAPRPGESCELCGAVLDDRHAHLVDLETHTLRCTCRPCALLFTSADAGNRYRTVPERVERLDVAIDDTEWQRLQIPVGIAFFFQPANTARAVAFYPGPAGATQSLLPLEDWEALASRHPRLAALAPDLEALLVRRRAPGGFDGFLVPIDRCYELVGRIRRHWRGFDGGEQVHAEIDGFFAGLDGESATGVGLVS